MLLHFTKRLENYYESLPIVLPYDNINHPLSPCFVQRLQAIVMTAALSGKMLGTVVHL
jgi:hypothetical protein